MNDGDICLADCTTMHTILQENKFYLNLIVANANVSTISGTSDLIEGSERACYQMELNSILVMHHILANQQEIFLVLKISVKMDIILKL